jgi:hypothetical protein
MKIRMGSVFAGLFALAVWSDDPFSEAPVPEAPVSEPPRPEVVVRQEVYTPHLAVGSAGVIVAPVADLKDQFWQESPILGTPNREWRVGDDEYVFPWAENGDRLIVLADPGDDFDPARLVSARMVTGRFAGRSYKIERKCIAAAK